MLIPQLIIGIGVLIFSLLFVSVFVMLHKIKLLKHIIARLEGEEKDVDDSQWGDSEGN